MTVAHRMAVMDCGRIVQVGTPAEVYEQPNSRYVAAFLGDVNLIEGRVTAADVAGTVIESPNVGTVRASACDAKLRGQKLIWVNAQRFKGETVLGSALVRIEMHIVSKVIVSTIGDPSVDSMFPDTSTAAG